jgi:hypothetical protein
VGYAALVIRVHGNYDFLEVEVQGLKAGVSVVIVMWREIQIEPVVLFEEAR